MVLDDIFSPRSGKGRSRAADAPRTLDEQLAAPIDRLAASVADLVLFLPILTLVLAPFSLRAKEAQLLGSEDVWLQSITAAVCAGAFVLILYQTIFVSLFGGTPGKLALRLRVVSLWQPGRPDQLRHPRAFEAFLRSTVWALEAACFGVPFLAVFSNLKRRPFHDRIADTAVVGLTKRRQAGLSTSPEMSVATGFQAAVIALVTLLTIVHVLEHRKDHEGANEAALAREDDGRLCADVREALESSGAKAPSAGERLETALGMYMAGNLEQDCLDGEAEFALWRGKETSLAYFAKGVVFKERNPGLSDDYFKKACGSSADVAKDICRVQKLVRMEARSDDDEDDAEDAAAAKVANVKNEREIDAITGFSTDSVEPGKSSFLQIAIIRYLMNDGKYAHALRWLDQYRGPRKMAAFVARTRIQALWRTGHHQEAWAAYRSTESFIEPMPRFELMGWMCMAETETGTCGERSLRACGELSTAMTSTSKWLVRPEIAAAYVRGETCAKNRDAMGWRRLKVNLPTEDAKAYVEALALMKEGRQAKALENLRMLAQRTPGGGPFSLEANLKLADLATSKEQLESIRERWRELGKANSNWLPLGKRLLSRYTQLGAWDEAVNVGLRLTQVEMSDRAIFETMVVAAIQSGNRRLAVGMLENALKLAGDDSSSRAPASVGGFERAAKSLRSSQ